MDTPVLSYISSINKSDTVVKSEIVTNDEDQVDFENIEIKHEFGSYSETEINSNGDPVTFNNVKTETVQTKTASKLRKVTPTLCVLCNTGFPSTDLYEDHVIATHQSELPYQCNFCKKRFKTSTNRKRHETIHDESRFDGPARFKCEFCEKSYHLKDSLETHRKIAHFGYKHNKKLKAGVVIQHHSKKGTRNPNANLYRKPKQSFECSKCSRVFSMKCELTNHMISHTDSRSFPCQYCEAAFKHRSSLTGHIRRIHELGQVPKMSRPRNKAGEPCVCSVCGKSYSVPNQLARHMLFHTGERPHKCTICGLSFRNFRGLRLHRLKHFPPDETGLRTFLCRICGKSGIKRFMDLSGHLKKHSFDLSGDTEILKPYACGICGKPYYLAIKAVTCALLLHDPTGLREKMFKFKCSECPEDFGYPCLASLRVHWEATHPGMEPPKQFRHPSYYKNITKELPSLSYDKEKVLELRHGSGVPPEVESSPFPLYAALDLIPDLHLKKERKKMKQRPKQSKYAECDNCGLQMLRHNLSRHLQHCGKSKKERKFEKKIVITDCKSIKCENVSSGSKGSNTRIVKASDSEAVRKIVCNQLVSVQLTRLPFLYS